jgi:hypothetical protein
MREIRDAKLAIMIRPAAFLKTLSKASLTSISEGVQPGRVALVESAIKARTPLLEKSTSLE